MKVIGAGFARTGTTSVMAALGQLGYGPVYHMNTIFAHPDHIAFWQAVVDGEQVDWHGLLDEYQSVLDWPASAYYEQLMQIYPQAKVLLTVRDPERWYDSFTNTIHEAIKTAASPVPDAEAYLRLMQTIIYDRIFGGEFEHRERAISIYNRHIEEVKGRVPPEKLLIYDVKEGWEPLCRFLGVAAPADQPFPHLNDTNAFRQWIAKPDAGAAVSQRG